MFNRYILEGISSDLSGGADIAVFISPYNTVANTLHQISRYTDEAHTKVRMTERTIQYDSGRVTVYTDALQARGEEFDVAIVPHGSAIEFPFFLDPRLEIIEY